MSSIVIAQTNSVVTVNADNVLVFNGQKKFTIGFTPGPPIYGKTPTDKDAMQEFRDAGALLFRMVQTANWDSTVISNQQAALDWAYQHDMFCWVNLRELSQFPASDTNTPASLRNIVDTFRNHPAVGLWKNFDEAWWGGVSVANLSNGFYVIKQEDTNHPVVQTHAPRGTVADLQPYNVAADILALDIYPVVAAGSASNPPITNTAVSQVGDWTAVLGQVANGQKNYWLIEQIVFSGTTPPSHTLVYPTFQQSRFMAYQAINNGARGLMFFGGNVAAALNSVDAPLGWNWTFWTNVLKPVVQQLGDKSQLAKALVTTNSTLPITFSGTIAPDIEFCAREVPPYLYILASKREGATTNVTFSGLPSWATNAQVLYESNRTVTATGGAFTDSFAALDVHVYRFAQSNQPPTILSNPRSQTNYVGGFSDFDVFADGTGALTYQWRKNGSPLSNGGNVSGATSSSLLLSGLLLTDAASYDVVVSGFGSVTSAPVAKLSVTNNQPPVITSQPQSRTNSTGTTATFSVTATSNGTLTYQWRKNSFTLSDGGNVSGATNSILTLSAVSSTDAASYDVVVTGYGSTTSAPVATLTVVPNPLLLYEPFSYTNISGQVNSNTPANWTLIGTAPNDLNVAGGNLSYPGLAGSIGNSVTNGGLGYGTRRLFGSSVSSGLIYFSALFRINNLGYGGWNGTATQVGSLQDSGNTARFQIQIKSNSATGYVIGLSKSGTGSTIVYDTTEYRTNDTILVVGKFDFTVSSNAAYLWINPAASTLGAPTAPASGYLFANDGTNGVAVDRFNMRQNTVASVPAAMQWDELRVATDWADVTPVATFTSNTGPTLTGLKQLAGGAFQFVYTNNSSQTFSVYATVTVNTNWAYIGPAAQISSGVYQFTDTAATNLYQRYYQLRSP